MKRLKLALALLACAQFTFAAPIGDPLLDGVNNSITFGDGSQASFTHTFDNSGTDVVLTISTGVWNLSTGQIQEGGSPVLTQADEGTGNGIDADTVDGVEASAFEEEGQINATNVTGNAADDQVLLGSGASALGYVTLPDCDNATTAKLLYDQTTNAFSCGTDQDNGGTNPLSISSPEALTISTGAVTLTGAANTITYHTIDTESAAASDDLDTINCTAGSQHVIYAASAARTVVVNAPGAPAFSLDNDTDRMMLHCSATNTVQELARANGGA